MITVHSSAIEYDFSTIEYIAPDILMKDPALLHSAWWDYRMLPPVVATYIYAESFKKAIKAAIQRRKCVYRGRNYKGLKEDDFLNCSATVITGIWKGRQTADEFGIEYDFYCDRAMHYAEKRDFKYLPSPHQLYSRKSRFEDDVSMVDFIRQEWEAANKNRLLHAQSAFYSIDAFVENRAQIEHQRFLLNAIKQRSSMKHVLLADLLYEKRLLTEAVVLKSIDNGESLIRQAKKFYK